MFQPGRMNQIDNFFMRNNNQVTPKRSHSPRVLQQQQQFDHQYSSNGGNRVLPVNGANGNGSGSQRSGGLLMVPQPQQQFFPSSNNKQNCLPINRASISPNKINGTKKPLIVGQGNQHQQHGGNGSGVPALLVSPRNKLGGGNSSNGSSTNNSNANVNGGSGYRQSQQNFLRGGRDTTGNGFLKKTGMGAPNNQYGSDIQFVMSRGMTTPTPSQSVCANHSSKAAEFTINIDCEDMMYCSGCASKLASQGFPVVRLQLGYGGINQQQNNNSSNRSANNPAPAKARPLPNYPEYRGNPFYQEISHLLKDLIQVQNNHYQTISRFSSLQSHYDNQISLTTDFYDQIQRTLNEMRQDHLTDLQAEKDKHTQLAQIQNDYLNENVEEIVCMREDIESNIQSIVTEIEEDSFKQCVSEYRQKLMMFKHTIEEKQDNFKEVTEYTEDSMRRKVAKFEGGLQRLWDDDQQKGDGDGDYVEGERERGLYNNGNGNENRVMAHRHGKPSNTKFYNHPQNEDLRNQHQDDDEQDDRMMDPQQSEVQKIGGGQTQSYMNRNPHNHHAGPSPRLLSHNQQQPQSQYQHQPVSVRNMHEMLPKSSVDQQQANGQGAFRHLFADEDEDEGEETLPIPSPQFKKI